MKMTGDKGFLFKGRRARLEVLVSPEIADDERPQSLPDSADDESGSDTGEFTPTPPNPASKSQIPEIADENEPTEEETADPAIIAFPKKVKRAAKPARVQSSESVPTSYLRKRG